jgi:hydrogenase-4 component B
MGIVVAAASGVPSILVSRHSMIGQWLSTALALLASGFGIAGIGVFWAGEASAQLEVPWALFNGLSFGVGMDGLSALFLLPIFVISLLGSVYGLGYWKQHEHPENGRKLRLFYGTLTAGMGLLVIARNSVVFLFGWETMALSAFFLVSTEEGDKKVREAGWLYLAATHVATLVLFGLFAVLRAASDSFTLSPLEARRLSPAMATTIFLLALVGFGLKAGLMPLHVWLPSAHAAAPSHVSAIMSGVLIKMGIYGLIRVTSFLANPPVAWGMLVLGLGVVSGILGVAYAIGQHDIKRLLAYHSIENIGIIVVGLGLALIGRSLRQVDWVVLGLGGSLLHVWNHALFKSLLFFAAGSIIHSTHTRDIDRLGGLAKTMPWTALSFLTGAVAICGLPPLNGFVSELLIYLGLFGALGNKQGPSVAALAVPALALMGAMAAACFVKVYGVAFLGAPRSEQSRRSHESPLVMFGPMVVLVFLCFLIGLAPRLVVPLVGAAISAWDPALLNAGGRLAALAPLSSLTVMGTLLLTTLIVAAGTLRLRIRFSGVSAGATWGCGYVAPSSRMQYTASSFAQMLTSLFAWALRPRMLRHRIRQLFPPKTAFHSQVMDPVLDDVVLPTFRLAGWLLASFRVLQRGSIQAYLLYIFITLIVLLLWH